MLKLKCLPGVKCLIKMFTWCKFDGRACGDIRLVLALKIFFRYFLSGTKASHFRYFYLISNYSVHHISYLAPGRFSIYLVKSKNSKYQETASFTILLKHEERPNHIVLCIVCFVNICIIAKL